MKKEILIFFTIVIVLIIFVFPKSVYASTNTTLDGIMEGGDDFLKEGSKTGLDKNELHETSNFTYNVLLGICMIIAVIVGMILGIKYMSAESEEKATIKETLIPFVLACVLMFGAFKIWETIVNILI